MIRAGKRETWKWEAHEIYELKRRLHQHSTDSLTNNRVILWAFDDSCLAHTKRRVLSISAADGAPEIDAIVRSVAEDAEELLAGLKRILRQILQVNFHSL